MISVILLILLILVIIIAFIFSDEIEEIIINKYGEVKKGEMGIVDDEIKAEIEKLYNNSDTGSPS